MTTFTILVFKEVLRRGLVVAYGYNHLPGVGGQEGFTGLRI